MPACAGLAGKTLAALLQTIHDAEDDWLLTRGSQETTSGLAGGRLTPDPGGVIRLQGYSSVGGLALSGNIVLRMDPYGDPVVPLTVQYALLSVGGPGAAHGRIRLSGNQPDRHTCPPRGHVALLAGPRLPTPSLDPPPTLGGGREPSAPCVTRM